MLFPFGVPGVCHEGLVAERSQGRGDQLDPTRMRPQRHLFKAYDHAGGVALLLRQAGPVAQIVGAQHDHRVGHAGLRQHVPVEASKPAVATQVVEDAVAAQPLVHDTERPPAVPRDQAAGKLVGPATERVVRRDVCVRQRVAQRDDTARLRRCLDVDPADEEPFVGELSDRHDGLRREIAGRRNIVGLPCIASGDLEVGRDVLRQINRHDQIGQRRHVERDRIAHQIGAGGEHRCLRPAERKNTQRSRNGRRPL